MCIYYPILQSGGVMAFCPPYISTLLGRNKLLSLWSLQYMCFVTSLDMSITFLFSQFNSLFFSWCYMQHKEVLLPGYPVAILFSSSTQILCKERNRKRTHKNIPLKIAKRINPEATFGMHIPGHSGIRLRCSLMKYYAHSTAQSTSGIQPQLFNVFNVLSCDS